MTGANSTEFEDNPEHAAVVFMPEISKTHLGGTMRLGSRPTLWQHEGSTIRKLYGPGEAVDERHRHRYEVNPDLIERIEEDPAPIITASSFSPSFESELIPGVVIFKFSCGAIFRQ